VPLSAALKDSNRDVRNNAAEALDMLDWRPGQNEKGAAYWAVKRAWDKCIEIGAPAVKPLITELGDGTWSVRRAAAESLVKLYTSNLLDEAHKHLILAQHDRIYAGHNDRTTRTSGSDCGHTDHTDSGIGVAFPV
jgi:HEAT repeat protein